ncbi:MAG: cytochrome c family protein, partial [Pseudomonadota bacterium]
MRRLAIFSLVSAATLAAGPAPAAEAFGDAAKGEKIFKKCKSCHDVGEGAKDRTGPHLNGVFGRAAAAHDGFDYSKSMKRAGDDGLLWTVETLDAYIENPRALVSKTRMAFRGVKDAEDRADLLAYLRIFSDNPRDLPEAEPTATATDHALDPEILGLEGDPEYG